MKRRILSVLVILCLIASLLPMSVMAASYPDTDGHWAESSIDRWSNAAVVQGTDGEFRPDLSITRAQIAAIFARLLRLPAASPAEYHDLTADAWYADAVSRCAAAGILTGYPDGTFRPNDPVTREQACAMLARALGIAEVRRAGLSDFPDAADTGDWAKGYVAAMLNRGILAGLSGKLAPKAPVTRAQFVTMLDRAIAIYADKDGATVKAGDVGDGVIVVVGENVKVKDAPEGATVVIGSNATGLSVNGETIDDYVPHYTVPAQPKKSGSTSAGRTHTHSYTAAVTTPATCGADGVLTYTCSCGATYTEPIPATGEHTRGADGICTVCHDGAAAKIGEMYYPTLKAAVAKVKAGDTLTLLADYSGYFEIKKGNVTLDLNGHTWSSTGVPVKFKSAGLPITVKNGTLRGGQCALRVEGISKATDVVLEDVVLEATSEGSAKVDLQKYARLAVEDEAQARELTGNGLFLTLDGTSYVYGAANDALSAAADALPATGGTIKLLGDHTCPSTEIYTYAEDTGKPVVFDLDGHTVSTGDHSGSAIGFRIKYANADVTLKNGTIETSGGYAVYADGKANDLKLTLDNMTLKGEHAGLGILGTLTGSEITIRDSSVTGVEYYGIYHPAAGTLTIEDSTVTGDKLGIFVKGGTVNISGDKTSVRAETATESAPSDYYSGSSEAGTSTAGYALYVEGGYNDRDIIVSVSGGTFTGTGAAVKRFVKDGEAPARTISLTAGTYSTDPSAYVADGYEAAQEDAFWYVRPAGSYIAEITWGDASVKGRKYTSLSAAYAAINAVAETQGASKAYGTVKLLADVTLDQDLTIGTTGALQKLALNGHTLTLKGDHKLLVTGDKMVTIEGSGTIRSESTSADAYIAVVSSGAGLTIRGTGASKKITLTGQKGVLTSGGFTVKNAVLNTVSDAVTAAADCTAILTVDSGTVLKSEAGSCLVTADGSSAKAEVKSGSSMTSESSADVIRWASSGTLQVKGGTFSGSSILTEAGGAVSISGGTYPIASKDALSTYIAEGYTQQDQASGTTYTVKLPDVAVVTFANGNTKSCTTLSSALSAVNNTTGAKITLVRDITEKASGARMAGGTAELDLAGHTITITGTSSGYPAAITLLRASKLTFEDSSAEQTGKMIAADSYCVNVGGTSELTIKSGSFSGSATAVQTQDSGKAYIQGGDFTVSPADTTNDCRYLLNRVDGSSSTIEVTGGTFHDFDPANNLADGENTNFVKEGYQSTESGGIYTVTQA